MPNNNAWNGKWSGEGNFYAKTQTFMNKKGKENAAKILAGRYYYYNFGDGWAAGITVKEVTSAEATQIRKKSKGFCGYDWMIDSIIKRGQILSNCIHGKYIEKDFHCEKCQEQE